MLPGTIMVFIASWLYMEAAPPKENPTPAEQTSKDEAASISIIGKLVAVSKVRLLPPPYPAVVYQLD
jgi:hypothetical protein